MARPRKSRKSTDKPKDGTEVSEKQDDTISATTEETSAEIAETSTETTLSAEGVTDEDSVETVEDVTASEAAEPESGETEEPEPVAEDASAPEEISAEPVDVEHPVTAATEATGDADLGDDTLVSEEHAETAGNESLPGLEETLEEAEDQTLVDDTDQAETTEESEPEAQVEPDPVPEPAAMAAESAQQQGSSFWPAVLGGVVAALLGFIAGRGDTLDGFLPSSMQRQAVDLTALETETAALAQSNADVIARLEAVEALEPVVPEPVDTSALTESLANLDAAIASVNGSLSDLSDRISALEDQPAEETAAVDAASTEDLAALQAALAAQQAAIDAQQAEIAGLTQLAADAEAAAASEARRILAKAALSGVVAAVNTGEPFTPALQDLEEAAAIEAPDPLRAAAETGVPTMAALQDSFPDAARAGLAAARAEAPESEVQGLTGFLRKQLNARSVVPREGDDPNAVLSRAEAALRNGDLDTALMETETLPDASKAAMSDWLDAAAARKAAQDAANALADSLNSN